MESRKDSKRILAISDIHGCYDELVELLSVANYSSAIDQLILMGDYTDRGQKSRQVIDKIIELVEGGAVALRGNHCEMFLNWLFSDSYNSEFNYFNNGGLQTIESYVGYEWFENGVTHEATYSAKQYIKKHFTHHINALRSTGYFFEIDNHVFVHAGIDPSLREWKDTTPRDMVWIREEFLNDEHSHQEIFVHGHTPCKLLHGKHDIYFGNKKIGIDGACAYGGQLNCLEIINGEYNQYSVPRNK